MIYFDFFSEKPLQKRSTKGFNHFANVVEGKNGSEILMLHGHRYRRDGVGDQSKYWRCVFYDKTSCRARVSSRIINGYEMAKMRNNPHNHKPKENEKTKSTRNDDLGDAHEKTCHKCENKDFF